MAKPERTVCLTCCERNSPTLVRCFLCGAVLNHEVKGVPAYYDEMRQRTHKPRASGDVIVVESIASDLAPPKRKGK